MNEFWDELWAKVKVLFGEIWIELWPTLKIMLTEAGKYTLQTAGNIVQQIQETMPTASGTEKFNAAFLQIESILISQGVKVVSGFIRVCIEIAYRKMVAPVEVVEEAKQLQAKLLAPPHPPVEP